MNKLNTTLWHMHIQWRLVVKVVVGAGSPRQPAAGRENTGGERENEENEKALASGILGVLAPAVRHLDETVGEVR